MHISPKNRLLALGLAGLLAVGAVGAVLADNPPGGGGDGPTTASAQAAAHHPRIVRATVKDIITQSGLSEDDFKQGFKDGKSVNTILTDNGKDPGAVQAAVLADIKTKLDELVANKTLTQEQADKAYAKAQEQLPKLMERTPGPGARFRAGVHAGIKELLNVAANDLNMDVKDLAQQLKSGKTIAQIATEKGVDVQTVINDMQNEARALMETAQAKLDQRIVDFVNNGRQ
ncbi:MAG: hypothetical protein IT304_06275 [Dehalococcoidia bacterium]|nr:hypothetical protein [Dehalococcoidia bacterium]